MWFSFLLLNREFWDGFCDILSLCLFSLFSHTSRCFTQLKKKREKQPNCSPFLCRKFGIIGFPFTNSADPNCSLLPVNCDKTPPGYNPTGVDLRTIWSYKHLLHLQSSSNTTQSMRIKDFLLTDYLTSQKCEFLTSFIFPNPLWIFYEITSPRQTLFQWLFRTFITFFFGWNNIRFNWVGFL